MSDETRDEARADYFESASLKTGCSGPVFSTATFIPLKSLAFQYVHAVLCEAGGNKTRAARMLGLDRRTLYRILARGSVGNVTKY